VHIQKFAASFVAFNRVAKVIVLRKCNLFCFRDKMDAPLRFRGARVVPLVDFGPIVGCASCYIDAFAAVYCFEGVGITN